MNDSMSLQLAESLRASDQTETQLWEDVSKSKLKISRFRSISAWFSAYTKDPEHPDKWAELLVAKEFQDRADMEERFVERHFQSLAKLKDLRRQILLLLEKVGKLETSIAERQALHP